MDIFAERSVGRATEDVVRFERSIDAKLVRIDMGFWNNISEGGSAGRGYVRLYRICAMT